MPRKKRFKGERLVKISKGGREISAEEKLFLFISAVCLIFILDRYTKVISAWFSGCFIFCIRRSFNHGAAFNLLSGLEWTRAFLILVALIVLFFIAFFYFQRKGMTLLDIGLMLLFAGTLGNLFDRIYYGYVIDWLSFAFWPNSPFNLADVSNLLGVIILITSVLSKREKEKRNKGKN